jgi:ribosome-binding factor A
MSTGRNSSRGQGETGRSGGSRRTERMGDLIKKEIAGYLIKGNKNPKIGFVTITSVKMTPDLQNARVYFSVFGSDKEKAETIEGLEESAGTIRGHLAKVLSVRFVPKIEFHVDEGLEHSLRVQTLLGQVRDESSENGASSTEESSDDGQD